MSLIQITIERIAEPNEAARSKATGRLSELTMPHWALGRLMDLAVDLAGMTGSLRPPVENRLIVLMAGDHGVTAEGVSRYPQEVTCQMVRNFVNGGAGINAIAGVTGSEVLVVDMGVAGDLSPLVDSGLVVSKAIARGTRNMTVGPAMTRDEAVRAVESGIEIALELSESTDVFGTGEMGIGNTTSSSAITAAITGRAPEEVTGRGTGLEDHELQHKIAVIEKSLRINSPDARDPLDVLTKIGGFEIGGIAGLILGAASMGKPVVIDGFISTAGALLAFGLNPTSRDFMIAAHRSVEPGHQAALAHLRLNPLLDLDMRLGEGTGAALAMTLLDASVKILTDVATFAEASVSGKIDEGFIRVLKMPVEIAALRSQ